MDIKYIVAKNISNLRVLNNMTQAELGEKLNYSDKTISKWERGDSIPDVAVLYEIANLFGVSLDYFVKEENINRKTLENKKKRSRYNRRAIVWICEIVAFALALLAFVVTSLTFAKATFKWLYFIYALPAALIVRLVFNSIWFNPKKNYLIISELMWSILIAVQLSFLYFGKNILLIYLLGAAGQIIIFIWSFIKNKY
ncbi:MAG: helix-turn-helix transcriptional regulator [Clostridia bacterium]|nr:helix-turn-helix transcriptional regulator [Clostridia bacterium]